MKLTGIEFEIEGERVVLTVEKARELKKENNLLDNIKDLDPEEMQRRYDVRHNMSRSSLSWGDDYDSY